MDPIDLILSHGSLVSNLKIEYFPLYVKVTFFSSTSERSVFKVCAGRNVCLSDPCFSTNVSFSFIMYSSICFVSDISSCIFAITLSFHLCTLSIKSSQVILSNESILVLHL
jgi:hypothetical protein